MKVQAAPFDDLDLTELYARRSAKWSVFPPDVLPAWVAEMDFPVAEPIRAALLAAIERSDLGYARAGNLGATFAAFAAAQFGWSLEPRDVVLIPDGIVGIAETLGVLTPRGARVVVNSPVYPPFFDTIAAAGRIVEDVPLQPAAGGWTIDLAALERAFAGGARAYLLCSPHNPLGRVFERDTLAGVAALSARYGVPVIADEIHAPLVLPGTVHTAFPVVAAEAGADSVVITSASKTWNLAGLKCAVLVAGSARMRERLDAIPEEVRYRAGHLGVIAALAAFTQGEPWRRDALAQIDRNRHLLTHILHERLPQIAYTPPQASYLAWLDCRALGLDDPTATFLQRGRVALTSGRPFRGVGPSFVRLNMGTSAAILTEIVARMCRALD